jgi:hypothetical protein
MVFKNEDHSNVVTRAGFKPTTACLEGRSSIQLSYRVCSLASEDAAPRGRGAQKGQALCQRPAKIKQIPVGTKPWFYLPSAQSYLVNLWM